MSDLVIPQPRLQAFEKMSDDEAVAWIHAGDYTIVAGLPLPESVSKQFAEFLSRDEVEGFTSAFGAGASALPGSDQGGAMAAFYRNCCAGAHFKPVTISMRKAGGDPQST